MAWSASACGTGGVRRKFNLTSGMAWFDVLVCVALAGLVTFIGAVLAMM
jgi:hypothetical protein